MRAPIRAWVLLLSLGLVAAACGDSGGGTTAPPPSTPPAVSFDGTAWVVRSGSVDGAAFQPIEGRTPTLAVDSGRASGSTGCNTYSAAFTVTAEGVVSLRDLAVTEIGCEPDIMVVEARLLAALGRVEVFDWDADRLTLVSADGSARLELLAAEPEPDRALDAATWMLTGFTAAGVASSVMAGTAPYLIFESDGSAVRGNGGCNDFGAEAAIAAETLQLTAMVYTEIACEEPVMRQEARYFGALADAATWEIEGSRLEIATGDGERLTFEAEPE